MWTYHEIFYDQLLSLGVLSSTCWIKHIPLLVWVWSAGTQKRFCKCWRLYNNKKIIITPPTGAFNFGFRSASFAGWVRGGDESGDVKSDTCFLCCQGGLDLSNKHFNFTCYYGDRMLPNVCTKRKFRISQIPSELYSFIVYWFYFDKHYTIYVHWRHRGDLGHL